MASPFPTTLPLSANHRGALLMSLCMFAFVLNDGLMKWLFAEMSIYQAIFLRGVVTVPLMAAMAWRQGSLILRLASHDSKDNSRPPPSSLPRPIRVCRRGREYKAISSRVTSSAPPSCT